MFLINLFLYLFVIASLGLLMKAVASMEANIFVKFSLLIALTVAGIVVLVAGFFALLEADVVGVGSFFNHWKNNVIMLLNA